MKLPLLCLTSCSQLVLPGSDRTGDSGALEAAVAAGDLLQVLLVVVFSVVELLPLQDLRGNGAVAFFIQLLGEKKRKQAKRSSPTTNYLCD